MTKLIEISSGARVTVVIKIDPLAFVLFGATLGLCAIIVAEILK